MMDFIYLLETPTKDFLCQQLEGVMGLVGWVKLGVQIAVPIILILVGMTDLTRAVTEKDDSKIKDAQSKLIKKSVAAVAVFLVMTLVGLITGLIGAKEWESCKYCLNSPWEECCQISNDTTCSTEDASE